MFLKIYLQRTLFLIFLSSKPGNYKRLFYRWINIDRCFYKWIYNKKKDFYNIINLD